MMYIQFLNFSYLEYIKFITRSARRHMPGAFCIWFCGGSRIYGAALRSTASGLGFEAYVA
jgi:hypothetical protein